MRSLRFLPLCFLAGVDGLNMFAPYAMVLAAAWPLLLRLQAARRGAQPIA